MDFDQPPTTKPIERKPERVLTKEEVMFAMSRFAENPTVLRELSNEAGLYLLEVQVEGEQKGETIEYQYMRKGAFPNQNREVATSICACYYQDGVPISGDTISVYKSETGEWEDKRLFD